MPRVIKVLFALLPLFATPVFAGDAAQIKVTEARVNEIAFIGGGRVYATVLNDSEATDGDIVLWLDQNGSSRCEVIFKLRAGYSVPLEYLCPEYPGGDFRFGWAWAEDRGDIVAVADRLTVN